MGEWNLYKCDEHEMWVKWLGDFTGTVDFEIDGNLYRLTNADQAEKI